MARGRRYRRSLATLSLASLSLACSYDYAAAYRCDNGARDGDETDVDCGGSCVSGGDGHCGYGKLCSSPADCDEALARCELGRCVPNKLTAAWRMIATGKPTPRFGARLTFRGNVGVLVGGLQASGVAPDMWTLEGESWFKRALTPPPRFYQAQALDPLLNVVLIAGGEATAAGRLGDVWKMDGAYNWTELAPLSEPRTKAALAHDGQRLILYGGEGAGGAVPSEPLLIRASASESDDWEPAATTNAPPVPHWHAMEHDPVRNGLVVFGGRIAGTTEGTQRTSLLDLETMSWESFEDTSGPSSRWGAAMAYDPRRQRIVMFAGRHGNDETSNRYNDTWEWDGAAWKQVQPHPASPLPAATFNSAMSYDPAGRQMIAVLGPVIKGFEPQDPSETWAYTVLGWPCASSDDCGDTTFCVDNVCCNEPCASGSCNSRDQPGICSAP